MSFKKIRPSFLNPLRIASAFFLFLGGTPLVLAKEYSSAAVDADSRRYEEGKRLLEQGKYEAATQAFQTVAFAELPEAPAADSGDSQQAAARIGLPAPTGLLRPRLAEWHAKQAQRSFEAKEYLAAAAHAQRAIELNPGDHQSRQLISKANQALKNQQQAIERNAQRQAALARQAQQAEQAGNISRACKLWQNALKLNPQDPQARQAVARLQTRWEQLHPPIKRAEDLKPTAVQTAAPEEEYRISIGDVLEVFIWQQPDLSRDVVVRPDGKISFPLVGDIPAANHTLSEVDDALTERLKTFVKFPDVSLAIKRFGGTKTIVMGEVNRPGIYVPTGEGRVMDVLAMAGGFSENANKNEVLLIRGGLASPQLAKLDIEKILTKGALQENVMLEANDILVVAKQGKSPWGNVKEVLDQLVPIMSETLIFQTVATNFGAREFQRTGRSIGVE